MEPGGALGGGPAAAADISSEAIINSARANWRSRRFMASSAFQES
jgi:hypothetical protein